jgi:hypothetical protein
MVRVAATRVAGVAGVVRMASVVRMAGVIREDRVAGVVVTGLRCVCSVR